MVYKSVTPAEFYLGSEDREFVLDNKNIIGFSIRNVGTANVTIFRHTVLQQDDCYHSPSNFQNLPLTGTIPIDWSSGTDKKALVYALVGNL